jgi:RHH-type proline utilization regulon transcriptional repressor/proline dehydrogenase/delta 1-pyrroline-5-carboxylate dehydrogenase
VNAATWGLVITGKLTSTNSETSLAASLARLISRGGEPVIRAGVDLAMRMMGEQFVTGQTIEEALARSRSMEARGFRYPTTCWARRRRPPRMPPATSGIRGRDPRHRTAAAAGRGVIDGRASRSSFRPCIRATRRAQLGPRQGRDSCRALRPALLARRY